MWPLFIAPPFSQHCANGTVKKWLAIRRWFVQYVKVKRWSFCVIFWRFFVYLTASFFKRRRFLSASVIIVSIDESINNYEFKIGGKPNREANNPRMDTMQILRISFLPESKASIDSKFWYMQSFIVTNRLWGSPSLIRTKTSKFMKNAWYGCNRLIHLSNMNIALN